MAAAIDAPALGVARVSPSLRAIFP